MYLRNLRNDIRAVKERDPAARNGFEIFMCYPGFHAIRWHRRAHALYRMGLRFLPRFIAALNRFFTGVDIHPAAKIGSGLFIDHASGVVIGETAVIGNNVTIYQGATLGGTGKDQGKRHPTVGNNVLLSCGAKVLGPFKIGDNARIASNAVVLSEVPPDATAVGIPAQIVRIAGKTTHYADEVDQTSVENPTLEKLEALSQRVELLEKLLDEKFMEEKKERVKSGE